MNFQYKQYLTAKNIIIVVMAVAIIILLFSVFKKKPEPVGHSGTITLLQEQIKILEAQNEDLKKKGDEQQAKDSALIKNYESRIWKDYQTIQQLKQKKDEKVIHIDTAGDAELRRILAEG